MTFRSWRSICASYPAHTENASHPWLDSPNPGLVVVGYKPADGPTRVCFNFLICLSFKASSSLYPSPERILGPQEKLLPPVFHLSHGQTVLPGRLGDRGGGCSLPTPRAASPSIAQWVRLCRIPPPPPCSTLEPWLTSSLDFKGSRIRRCKCLIHRK